MQIEYLDNDQQTTSSTGWLYTSTFKRDTNSISRSEWETDKAATKNNVTATKYKNCQTRLLSPQPSLCREILKSSGHLAMVLIKQSIRTPKIKKLT